MYGQNASATLPVTGVTVLGTALWGFTAILVGIALLGVLALVMRASKGQPMP